MKLRDWRTKNKKTLAWLAEEAKTTDATISRIEQGKQRPTPDLAKRLQKVTGIPAATFVMGEAA